MKYLIAISFTLVIAAFAIGDTCESSKGNFCNVRVVKVYDGDTITVNIKDLPSVFGSKISVRIRGIDTAEIRGRNHCEKTAARTARKLVENLVKNGKTIHLLKVERDKYFRLLADVSIDGKMVRDVLLKNRLAVAYEGKSKERVDWCKRIPASKE